MTAGSWAVLAAVAVVLLGVWLSWTAGRLDRQHARVDAAWSALDAQLVRRAAAARALAAALPGADAPAAGGLAAAALAALASPDHDREQVENALTRGLREAARDAQGAAVPDPLWQEVAEASLRVTLARAVHGGAVTDARALRFRRAPRLLRLAGRRAMPTYFEIEDPAAALGERGEHHRPPGTAGAAGPVPLA